MDFPVLVIDRFHTVEVPIIGELGRAHPVVDGIGKVGGIVGYFLQASGGGVFGRIFYAGVGMRVGLQSISIVPYVGFAYDVAGWGNILLWSSHRLPSGSSRS